MKPRVQKRDRIDHKIVFVVAGLVAFGLVMVYSVAISAGNAGMFQKQAIGMFACFLGMLVLYHFDLHFDKMAVLKKLIPFIYILSYAAIFALLLPSPFTKTVNGATRWIRFGPINVQVAEFVKIAVILALARFAEKYSDIRRNERKYNLFMPFLGLIPTALLLLISNDLSSSMVIAGITFVLCFLSSRGRGSIAWYVFWGAVVMGGVAVAVFYVKHNMPDAARLARGEISFRIGRVAAWLDPKQYVKSVGFQPLHCLYAIANGGWLGKGLGQGWQKSVLPESENDVIFAVLVEELGIAGGIILLFIFFVLITLLYKVADRTDKIYDKMVVVGVVIHIVLQVLIHCAVSTNSIPNTGIGLPFISYGISAILFMMAEITLILWIAKSTILDPDGEKKQEIIRARKEKRHAKKVKQRRKKAQKSTGKSKKTEQTPLPANVKAFPGNANSQKKKKSRTQAEKDAARKAALMRVTENSRKKPRK